MVSLFTLSFRIGRLYILRYCQHPQAHLPNQGFSWTVEHGISAVWTGRSEGWGGGERLTAPSLWGRGGRSTRSRGKKAQGAGEKYCECTSLRNRAELRIPATVIQWRAGQGMEPQSVTEVQKQGSNTQWGSQGRLHGRCSVWNGPLLRTGKMEGEGISRKME